jgi:hypothetical protein
MINGPIHRDFNLPGIDAAVNCKEGLFDQAQMNLGFKVFEE